MGKKDLELYLAGKPVPKKLKSNQKCVETQTDFPVCNNCGLEAYMMHLSFKAEAEERKRIIHDDDLEIAETGEVVGVEIDYSKQG